MRLIIDKSSMIIRCIWIIVNLSNEIEYKLMMMLVIRKGNDCDNYQVNDPKSQIGLIFGL